MVVKKKSGRRQASLPIGIAFGAGTSLLLALLGAALLAWLMNQERLPEENVGIAAAIVLLAASLLGSWLATGKTKEKRLIVCMSSGLLFFLLLLSCTALFFGGQYQGLVRNALAILLGCGIPALLGLKGEGRKKSRLKKYASR